MTVYVFYRNIGHRMHRFWDISSKRSQKPNLDICDLENDFQSDSTPFIFYDRISFTNKKLNDALNLGSTQLPLIDQKIAKFDVFLTFKYDLQSDLIKSIFWQSISSLLNWEASIQNREQVIEQFFRKLPQSEK